MILPKSPCIECKRRPCPKVCYPKTLDNSQAMKICFAMIDVADAVFFMPEWDRSIGAKLEHAYCKYLNKEIYYLPAKP